MNHAARLAREDAITDALRAVNDAIGDEEPADQSFRIIEAIKRLRSDRPLFVTSTDRVDYLERAQNAARRAWVAKHGKRRGVTVDITGPEADAVAGIDTPIGVLRVVTWRKRWAGKRGDRTAWASEYYLNDEPITLAEIRAAGLARRPTTRNRKRNNDER